MGYLAGLGDVTAADFVVMGSVCKPRNFETLDKFKALQTQLNRGAEAKGVAKIAVDGDIGPATVKLLAAVTGGSASASASSIALVAEALTAQVKSIADQAGIPSKVSSPKPATTPAIVNAAGAIVPQPVSASAMDAFNRMSTMELAIAGIVLGGGAFLLLGKKKRRK
jgi:hypothetical protein